MCGSDCGPSFLCLWVFRHHQGGRGAAAPDRRSLCLSLVPSVPFARGLWCPQRGAKWAVLVGAGGRSCSSRPSESGSREGRGAALGRSAGSGGECGSVRYEAACVYLERRIRNLSRRLGLRARPRQGRKRVNLAEKFPSGLAATSWALALTRSGWRVGTESLSQSSVSPAVPGLCSAVLCGVKGRRRLAVKVPGKAGSERLVVFLPLQLHVVDSSVNPVLQDSEGQHSCMLESIRCYTLTVDFKNSHLFLPSFGIYCHLC